MDTNQTQNQKESIQTDAPHKTAGTAAVSIAGCAFASFILAALSGAAWAGAVVASAMSLMGIGVVYFIMRRA